MTSHPTNALDLLRQVLAQFSDVPADQVVPEAELASLQVDSLTAAEMLFELEDRLGQSIADPGAPPRTVADVIALIAPHVQPPADRAAA
jgi:acyl carrier protein